MVKRRLALATVTTLALVTAISLTARPSDDGPTPSTTIEPVTSIGPASTGGSWWALEVTFVEPSRMSGLRLALGVLGESTTVVERGLDDLVGEEMRWGRPRAGGPDAGHVAYSFRNGASAEIWVVDAATGRERKVASRPADVAALDLDLGAGFVYTVETTALATRFVIARTDLATGTTTALTELAREKGPDGSVDARLVDDATMLVVLTCGGSCRAAGIRTIDGTVQWDRPIDATLLIGGIPGAIGAMRTCGLPCPAKLIHTVTGDLQDLGRNCEAVSLALRDGNPAMVTDSAGRTCRGRGERWKVAVYQADQRDAIATRDVADGQTIVVDGGATGYDTDPGWALLSDGAWPGSADDPAPGLSLLDVESGEIITLEP